LRVDDFAVAHERMRDGGVEFLSEPREEPYGTVAIFRDISGNRWDLLGRDWPRKASFRRHASPDFQKYLVTCEIVSKPSPVSIGRLFSEASTTRYRYPFPEASWARRDICAR